MSATGPALSLCMIVRDEEEMLPGCLESISGVVDELVVVDTGSADDTLGIVERYGNLAKVRTNLRKVPWKDDFSAARNVSIEAAAGEWILWMDADERLRPGEHGLIRRAMRSGSVEAFLVSIRSDTPTGGHVTQAHRLFRNHKGIRFSGRVHEQISTSFTRIRARVGTADFTIDHLGYNLSAERLRQKNERNLRLLSAAKQENPRDAYVRFSLGQTLMLLGDAAAAEQEVLAALGEGGAGPVSTPLPADIRASAFNNLAQYALERGSFEEALRRCAQSLSVCPRQVTAHLMAYRAHQRLGREGEALRELVAADGVLDGKPGAGCTAIEVTVDRRELWRAMGQIRLQLGQPARARRDFERALRAGSHRPAILADLARCAIAEDALEEAHRLALEACTLLPADDGLADLLCFILLKQRRFGEAADRMRVLLERRPGDGVLRRRLAGVLVKAGRAPEGALTLLNIEGP